MTKLHTVLPPASDTKFVGHEPSWLDVEIADEHYSKEIVRGLNWHNYCASDKDHAKYLEAWAKVNRTTSKTDIAAIKGASSLQATFCNLARMHLQGFPLSEHHLQSIHDYIDFTLLAPRSKKVASTTAQPVKVVSVQDRIRQQVTGALSDLDAAVDQAFDGNLPDPQKIAGDILTKGFKAPQLKLVTNYLNANLSEWENAYNKEDEQLVEGYAYVKRRLFKQIIDTFNTILEVIATQQTQLKAQRVIRKKPLDKKKLASKLKFMKEYTEYGVKSANAVDIIGANMVWVFDTKTRRIGVYEAELKDSLIIRGARIDGFKFTCTKILRKPEIQLAEFMKLRKTQTMNWLDGIKAKCGVMTGRTNANIILLRVD